MSYILPYAFCGDIPRSIPFYANDDPGEELYYFVRTKLYQPTLCGSDRRGLWFSAYDNAGRIYYAFFLDLEDFSEFLHEGQARRWYPLWGLPHDLSAQQIVDRMMAAS